MSETLRELRLFRSVYETSSFTAAGIREHLTQSGVSQQIRKLEQTLGVTLFERRPGRVTPTPEGELYYGWCVEILCMCRKARASVRKSVEGKPQTLAIGTIPVLSAGPVGTAVRKLLENAPGLEIRVVEGFTEDLAARVRARELDIALGCYVPEHPGIKSRPYASTAEGLLYRKDASRQLTGPLSAAGPLKLALFGPPAHRAFVQTQLSSHGAVIERVLEFESLSAVLDLVSNSDWVAVIPEGSTDRADLAHTVIAEPRIVHEFYVHEPDPPRASPAVQTLRRLLQVA